MPPPFSFAAKESMGEKAGYVTMWLVGLCPKEKEEMPSLAPSWTSWQASGQALLRDRVSTWALIFSLGKIKKWSRMVPFYCSKKSG